MMFSLTRSLKSGVSILMMLYLSTLSASNTGLLAAPEHKLMSACPPPPPASSPGDGVCHPYPLSDTRAPPPPLPVRPQPLPMIGADPSTPGQTPLSHQASLHNASVEPPTPILGNSSCRQTQVGLAHLHPTRHQSPAGITTF